MSIDITMATNISEEDMKLLAAFKSLKVAPKADSPEDLYRWLSEFGDKGEKKPQEAQFMGIPSQSPRLSIFFGDTASVTKGEATYDQWKYKVKCF